MEPTTETDLTVAVFTLLTWLSGPASGMVASWLQGGMVAAYPAPAEPPKQRWRRWFYIALHAPRYKLRVSFALAFGISTLAGGALAFMSALASGEGVKAALSVGLAWVLSLVVNQMAYRDKRLEKEVWADE